MISEFTEWRPFSDDQGILRLSSLTVRSELRERIMIKQKEDSQYGKMEALALQEDTVFQRKEDGSIWFKDRLWVPSDPETREELLAEAHKSKYTIHPGSTKMFKDLQLRYWWNGMKRDVAR